MQKNGGGGFQTSPHKMNESQLRDKGFQTLKMMYHKSNLYDSSARFQPLNHKQPWRAYEISFQIFECVILLSRNFSMIYLIRFTTQVLIMICVLSSIQHRLQKCYISFGRKNESRTCLE